MSGDSDNAPNAAARFDIPPVDNPPGLDALAYRVRTHGRFTSEMKKALAKDRLLRPLTHASDSDGDPSLALMDAWATTLGVLTFYQERIANEGYLRTATEQRSVQELGRAVGYELNPGIAAETYLAFTLDDTPGAPDKVAIDAGMKVQSVPGPGEQAQIFETVEKIEARPEWNALKPQMTQPPVIGTELYVAGISTGLRPGDGLLIVGDERKNAPRSKQRVFGTVQTVQPDAEKNRTLVTWREEIKQVNPPPALTNPEALALRLHAGLFGGNAPDWLAMPHAVRKGYLAKANKPTTTYDESNPQTWGPDWPELAILTAAECAIHLDNEYPKIIVDSWVVLANSGQWEVYKVKRNTTESRTDFTISSRCTRLTLDMNTSFPQFGLRGTTVFAESEPLKIADPPILDTGTGKPQAITGATILLAPTSTELVPGQWLVASGKESGSGASISELVAVMTHDGQKLTVAPPLTKSYARESFSLNANVARATHGETRQEVLGSADAAQSFQQFALRQAPLTFTPAATQSGGADTLKIRVNDILWDEKPTVYEALPRERVFTAKQGPDGKFVIQFGDGVSGARPPSGDENVSATYRVGLGAAGNVKAGQLRVLLTRLLGVRGVSNPQDAAGGADPEGAADARLNVPYQALTLDRIVTLRDYEDFARAFGGVGKARADWLWDGSRGVVFVTVVDAHGNRLDKGSEGRLRAAMETAHDPAQVFCLEPTAATRFSIRARLVIDPHVREEAVEEKAAAALREAFSLTRREFGQDVNESEILGLLQSVDGVVAADVTEPYPDSTLIHVKNPWRDSHRLTASFGQMIPTLKPAELLLLDEDPEAISLRVVSDLSEPEEPEGAS